VIPEILKLASLNLRVFPTGPDCKRPLTPDGCHGATTDTADIARLWREHPGARRC